MCVSWFVWHVVCGMRCVVCDSWHVLCMLCCMVHGGGVWCGVLCCVLCVVCYVVYVVCSGDRVEFVVVYVLSCGMCDMVCVLWIWHV